MVEDRFQTGGGHSVRHVNEPSVRRSAAPPPDVISGDEGLDRAGTFRITLNQGFPHFTIDYEGGVESCLYSPVDPPSDGLAKARTAGFHLAQPGECFGVGESPAVSFDRAEREAKAALTDERS